MTIKEAINNVDKLVHNAYTVTEKIAWLSDLDGMVKINIIDTHEGGQTVAFEGYTDNTDLQTELLVQAPFDKVYLWWLEAQIHKHNEETNRWNNAIILYNHELDAFASYYHRTHRPVGGSGFRL